jgi:DNA-binding CsgD family transcriptional regulator
MGNRDLRQVLHALDELARAGQPGHAAQAALAAARCSAGADSAVISRFGDDGATVWAWPPEFLDDRQQAIFEAVNAVHPWPLAVHTRQGSGLALRISDIWSWRQYRSSPMYGELFRDLAVRHQVAFSVPTRGRHALCIALQRDGRDFTDTDCDNLNALRPCLGTAARRPPPTSSGLPASSEALTRREYDILHLAVTGMSDVQIGRRLGISKHTVSKHLQHLYRKIGVTNRTQAADSARPLTPAPLSVDAFVALVDPATAESWRSGDVGEDRPSLE